MIPHCTTIALLLVLALAGCGPSTPMQQETREKKDEGLFEMQGLQARIHKDEGLQTLIRADQAFLDLNQKVATLESVAVEHFTSGTLSGRLRSDEGVLYLADNTEAGALRNDFVLRGHDGTPVVITKGGDMTILARAVRYNSANDEATYVTEDGPVEQRVKTGNSILVFKGSRFEMNRSLSAMRMLGPKGELHIGGGNSKGGAVSD